MNFLVCAITMIFGCELGFISNVVDGNVKDGLFSSGLTLIVLAAIRTIIHLNYSHFLEKLSCNMNQKHPDLNETY